MERQAHELRRTRFYRKQFILLCHLEFSEYRALKYSFEAGLTIHILPNILFIAEKYVNGWEWWVFPPT